MVGGRVLFKRYRNILRILWDYAPYHPKLLRSCFDFSEPPGSGFFRMKASRVYKKQTLQQRGCKALCCSCRLSVSSSEEAESSNSDRFASISSLAHAMVQERLDQMIRERKEARQRERRRRLRSDGTKFIVMVAMEKSSYDPREDFRESMVDMIMANRLQEPKDLRSLLNYYMSMNSEEYHGMILEVFHEHNYMWDISWNVGISGLELTRFERCRDLPRYGWNTFTERDVVEQVIIVAPNDTIIMATERNRNVKLNINLFGSVCLKSLNRNGDVRIERNVTTEVKANVRESTSVTVKTTNNGLLRRRGTPVLSSGPPGTV
ncbi:unnamed protein product [Dovyalis caffra]|uniref:Transcription repressor n=1 Tax=Dovyalis caffra TaxID=77055 RepID=A0AAV1SIC1_9ROSI|nr:unnamed protein product [Dovyalis caffra]